MNSNNVVIDLETLDTAISAAFFSIGAVRVNFMTGEIVDQFVANIDIDDAKEYGTTSKSTLEFWRGQPEEVREQVRKDPRPLKEVMYDFSCWINSNDRVWGNGALFDIGILEHYYNSTNSRPPWKFWNVRDMRTVVEIGQQIFGVDKKSIPFEGLEHVAIDDAVHEAKVISAIYRKMAGK